MRSDRSKAKKKNKVEVKQGNKEIVTEERNVERAGVKII